MSRNHLARGEGTFAGFVQGRKVVLNPGRRRLKGGEAAVCVATSQAALDEALARRFSRALHPLSGTHSLSPDLARGPATVRPWPEPPQTLKLSTVASGAESSRLCAGSATHSLSPRRLSPESVRPWLDV